MSEAEKLARLAELEVQGERAKAAVTAWKDAFEATRADLLAEYEATRFEEHDKRERIYDSLRALNHMFQFLKRRAIEGEGARKELLNIKDPSRIRSIFNRAK